MHSIYCDAVMPDDQRREKLYQGQLFQYSACDASLRLICHAREMIEEAFNGIDPVYAQFHMPVEEYVSIVSPLKPRFIHDPRTKQILQDVLQQVGCDPDLTYQDVPRLRMVTSDGYLTSGVGYAHHPHRDTWYSAPMAQINWWLPIYPMESESAMAFHPHYWKTPVLNSSSEFNYDDWNANGRANAAQHIKSDTRKQSKPLETIELEPEIRVVLEPGAMLLFSAAHMHSTVPNTSGRTRYSIDFRTVHIGDVRNRKRPPNVDSYCTGTSIRDFLRSRDLTPVPDDVVAIFENNKSADRLITQMA
jgi:hypothetical protein